MRLFLLVLACAVGFLAQADADSSQVYSLEKDSEFEYGCFGPCACPILVQSGVDGGFLLSPRGPDGLFFDYDVLDVRWFIPQNGDSIPVTGYGTYRIGGEFANQEQLTLDLAIGGGAPRIYDSGIVTKVNQFPVIDLDVASSGFSCFDTVFAVHASPRGVTGAPGAGAYGLGIVAVRPNPTPGGTTIEFVTPAAGLVSLTLLDARGRNTAVVLETSWMEAGPHRVWWQGAGARGTRLPPGLYLIELRLGHARSLSRLIVLSTGSVVSVR